MTDTVIDFQTREPVKNGLTIFSWRKRAHKLLWNGMHKGTSKEQVQIADAFLEALRLAKLQEPDNKIINGAIDVIRSLDDD